MTDTKNKVKLILEWLVEKKAENIISYDLSAKNTYTDFIIVCEGQADLHVRAIGNHVLDQVKEHHFYLLSKEGLEYANWVLIDLGDVIIHIFLPEKREYYKIDDFITNYLQKMEPTEK
jgi:ribosome-associated protein